MKYNSKSKIKKQKAKIMYASHINYKIWAFLFFICVFALFFFIFNLAGAAKLSGKDIIEQVDKNLTFGTAYFEAKMIIYVGDEVREKRMEMYSEGSEKGFAEFTYPARDKGVKYLRIGDQMWMYLPSVEKIIKIAGHMLRQSMMGSDYSYEDALEARRLMEKYDAHFKGEEPYEITRTKEGKETKESRPTYVVGLIAKVKDVTYYKRMLWVDKETFIPLKEELYAKSGKLLKVSETEKIDRFGTRFYPTKSVLRNLLRKNSRTEFIITKAQFDIKIPAGTFTERNLKK